MYKYSKNSFGQTIVIKDDGDTQTSFLADPEHPEYQRIMAMVEAGGLVIAEPEAAQ